MKRFKICFIAFLLILLIISVFANYNNLQKYIYALKSNKISTSQTKKDLINSIPKDKVLTKEDLKLLFPDANFRDAVIKNFDNRFDNSEITLNRLYNLKGELYAASEDIESLEGISNLKNIESFVFSNNSIKKLPNEMLKLNKIKNLNLLNNYITESLIIDNLIKNGTYVNYNLNFIKDKKNQYKLFCIYQNITLNKNEEIALYKLLYKHAQNYEQYFEIKDDISPNIKYITSIKNDKIVKIKDDCKLKAISSGKCQIKISLTKDFNTNSSVVINIKVR